VEQVQRLLGSQDLVLDYQLAVKQADLLDHQHHNKCSVRNLKQ